MAKKNNKVFTIPIEGIVGIDVTSEQIRKQLDLAGGNDIEFHFNTPGGFIFANLQIFNLIKNYQGKTTGILSLAASMGSYLFMAVDEKIVEDNGVFMIHNARQGAGGDHRDLRRSADLLERTTSLLSTAYAVQSGKSESQIKSLMDNETFLFGQEIVDEGFADSVRESGNQTDKQAAILLAQNQFADAKAKLKDGDNSDMDQAAALLEPEPKAVTTTATKMLTQNDIDEALTEVESHPKFKSTHKSDPDNSGKNNRRIKMTLDQFLIENPEAKAEHDKRVSTARAEGSSEIQSRIEAVVPYLGNEKYTQAQSGAIQALKGEVSLESFKGSIMTLDMLREQTAEGAAVDETGKIKETPAGQVAQPSAGGKVEKPEDITSVVADLKTEIGAVA